MGTVTWPTKLGKKERFQPVLHFCLLSRLTRPSQILGLGADTIYLVSHACNQLHLGSEWSGNSAIRSLVGRCNACEGGPSKGVSTILPFMELASGTVPKNWGFHLC